MLSQRGREFDIHVGHVRCPYMGFGGTNNGSTEHISGGIFLTGWLKITWHGHIKRSYKTKLLCQFQYFINLHKKVCSFMGNWPVDPLLETCHQILRIAVRQWLIFGKYVTKKEINYSLWYRKLLIKYTRKFKAILFRSGRHMSQTL